MALLKSGSTVGGNLIWHQGILPVFPSGDTVYFKDYKIYTTKDKPTPEEIGTFDKFQINKSFSLVTDSFGSPAWYKIGTANISQGGKTLRLDISGGNGYNGHVNQGASATIVLRTGNGAVAVNAAGRLGVTVHNISPDGVAIVRDAVAIETTAHFYDIYALFGPYMTSALVNVTAESLEFLNAAWESKYERQTVVPTGNQFVDVSTVYTTSWKPTKADVGLGNLSNDLQVKKAGDTMTGRLDISYNVNNAQELLNISSQSATPIRLYKPGSTDHNISIQFRNDAVTRYLGLGPNQELRWGINLDQASNAKVYTTEHRPSHSEVNAFYQAPNNLDDANLNDIRTPGQFKQVANALALLTRNYPRQVAGTLTVYINSANNWGFTQEYRPFDRSQLYVRRSTGLTTWSTWTRVYQEEDKPTYDELGFVTNANHNNWDSATSGYLRRVQAVTGGPEQWDLFGITSPSNDDQWGFQIGGRTNRFYLRTKDAGKYLAWERIYTTGYKPNNGDVGLGNVTNDAQIKRNGDTINARIINSNEWVGNVSVGGGGQFRAAAGNYGFILRNDGSSTYFLLTRSGDSLGTWEDKANEGHPIQINNATRDMTLGAQLIVRKKVISQWAGSGPRFSSQITPTGSDQSIIGGQIQGGAHTAWRDRAAGMLIECPSSENSAYNVWKATHWGKYHIAAVDVHAANGEINQAVVRQLVGNQVFNFRGNGNFEVPAWVYAGEFYLNSDRTLKDDIRPLESMKSKLHDFDIQRYKMKDGSNDNAIGVIAQEVEEVFPELISSNDKGIKSVNYRGLSTVLWKIVQEQDIEITDMKSRLDRIEKLLK